MLVQRGGTGGDGRLDSREERDFGEQLLTERAFEQLAQKEALSDAVVRAGEALTLQLGDKPLQPILPVNGNGSHGTAS